MIIIFSLPKKFLNSKATIWNILHPEMFSQEFCFWGYLSYLPWQTLTNMENGHVRKPMISKKEIIFICKICCFKYFTTHEILDPYFWRPGSIFGQYLMKYWVSRLFGLYFGVKRYLIAETRVSISLWDIEDRRLWGQIFKISKIMSKMQISRLWARRAQRNPPIYIYSQMLAAYIQ